MSERRHTANTLKKFLGPNLTFAARRFIASRPALYFGALKLAGKNMSAAVRPDTALLTAGIWGCANTYAREAFKHNQPDVHLAHHMHVPAQVFRAIKYKVPTLVLVRHPFDAISSYTSRNGLDLTMEDMTWGLKDYAYYYNAIIDCADYYETAEFGEVVKDFTAPIARVNARFGTSFTVPENGSPESEEIRKNNKFPGYRRLHAVDDIKEFLQRPELRKYLEPAEDIYQRFCERTGTEARKDPPRPPMARRPQAPEDLSS